MAVDEKQLSEQLQHATKAVNRILSVIKTYDPKAVILQAPKVFSSNMRFKIGHQEYFIIKKVAYDIKFVFEEIDGALVCSELIILPEELSLELNGHLQIKIDIEYVVKNELSWIKNLAFTEPTMGQKILGAILQPKQA